MFLEARSNCSLCRLLSISQDFRPLTFGIENVLRCNLVEEIKFDLVCKPAHVASIARNSAFGARDADCRLSQSRITAGDAGPQQLLNECNGFATCKRRIRVTEIADSLLAHIAGFTLTETSCSVFVSHWCLVVP